MPSEIENKLIKCLEGICSGFSVRKVDCSGLSDSGGVYVIVHGGDYVIGYSKNLKRRLMAYCTGDLEARGVFRLLTGSLDALKGVGGDAIGMRRALRSFIKGDVIGKSEILVINCPSMGVRELYIRLGKCVGQS